MKRSLVKQGPSTLMISLPSSWIKKFNLEKGDNIELEEIDNNLVISKDEIRTKKETKINLSNYTESSIRTLIINAYRSGYDLVTINFQDEKQFQIINNTINNYLIGFEIIKKEKNKCIIENITEPSENQFEILFRKILYNISSLINTTESRLRNKEEDYTINVLKIHQYDNFCRRVLSKRNLYLNSTLFWSFLTLLVHAQRELYHLNKYLDNNKVNFTNFDFILKLKEIFQLLEESYIKKDIKNLEKIHELEKKIIYKDFYQLIQKNKKENIILYHLASSIRNFYLCTSPLLGILLANESTTSKWTSPEWSVI